MIKRMNRSIAAAVALLMLIGIVPVTVDAQEGQSNLALNRPLEAFELQMEGAGSDLDPATRDVTIREKEESILPRLVDGVYGNGDILDGDWNGDGERTKYAEFYRNVDREITLDLGQLSHVDSIALHINFNLQFGVAAPPIVSFFLSEDGQDFRLVGRGNQHLARVDEDAERQTSGTENLFYEVKDLDHNARYVKFSFELSSTWAFMDEFEVWGQAAPSATALPLPDTTGSDNPIVDAYASPELSRGIRHEALAYAGFYTSSGSDAVSTSEKREADLLPLVAYVGENGEILDTFFDSVTFLSHGIVPGERSGSGVQQLIYINDLMTGKADAADHAANKDDWQTWLDFIFDYDAGDGNTSNLDALEETVGDVKSALELPEHKVGVKLAVYPPISVQDDWGSLEGGRSLNFRVSDTNSPEQAFADRMAAMEWYLDQVTERFAAKGYEHLRLDGFYYFEEIMHYSTDPIAIETVQGINALIDEMADGAYQSYWIPFYQATGFRSWDMLGFDYAVMQPGYAFNTNLTSTQRLADAAALSQKYGLGVEMEFGGINDTYIDAFWEYLAHGADDELGYQNNSIMAWYTGTWGVRETSRNVQGSRPVYDAMYDFFSGVPVLRPGESADVLDSEPNILVDSALSLSAEDVLNEATLASLNEQIGLLVDGTRSAGVWGSDAVLQINSGNGAVGPYAVTAELELPHNVKRLALSAIEQLGWGIGAPDSVSYLLSEDGVCWTEVGTVQKSDVVGVPGEANGAFTHYPYTLELAEPVPARYIRAVYDSGLRTNDLGEVVPYGWSGIDAFIAHGEPTVNKSELQTELATRYPELAYTEASYAAYRDGVIAAEDVLADAQADQAQVDEALAGLRQIAKALVRRANRVVDGELSMDAAVILNEGAWSALQAQAKDIVADGIYADGVWGPQAVLQVNALNMAEAPYTLTVEWPEEQDLNYLGLHAMARTGWGIAAPDRVSYYASTDGEAWELLGTVEKADAIERAGAAASEYLYYEYGLGLAEDVTARYVRAVFESAERFDQDEPTIYAWIGVDEFFVTAEPIEDEPVETEPTETEPTETEPTETDPTGTEPTETEPTETEPTETEPTETEPTENEPTESESTETTDTEATETEPSEGEPSASEDDDDATQLPKTGERSAGLMLGLGFIALAGILSLAYLVNKRRMSVK